jgi:hypothetical protein
LTNLYFFAPPAIFDRAAGLAGCDRGTNGED